MTMIRVLPNRYIALLMTPREASMLEGQILDPSEFPWQDSETQVVAMGVKMQLHTAVAEMVARELDASIDALTKITLIRERTAGAPPPPEEDLEDLNKPVIIIDTQEETHERHSRLPDDPEGVADQAARRGSEGEH